MAMRKKPKREGREVTFVAGLATWGGGVQQIPTAEKLCGFLYLFLFHALFSGKEKLPGTSRLTNNYP
jgi:hypothetical protein